AGELIRDRPDVELYVYGNAAKNLDFLAHFKELRRLHLALWDLENIAGFENVASSLEALTFGSTKKEFSLRFLESHGQLKSLFLVGHKKEISVIGTLTELDRVGLSGITLPGLSLLLPLQKLRAFSLFLGGTTALDVLAELPALEELFLMRITKLSNVV